MELQTKEQASRSLRLSGSRLTPRYRLARVLLCPYSTGRRAAASLQLAFRYAKISAIIVMQTAR